MQSQEELKKQKNRQQIVELVQKGYTPEFIRFSKWAMGEDVTQVDKELEQLASFMPQNSQGSEGNQSFTRSINNESDIPGGSVDQSSLKNEQATSLLYGQRAYQASQSLNNFDTTIANKGFVDSLKQAAQEKLVGGTVTNRFVDPEFQQYEQAKRNFVNAVLRRESGAVISDEEFSNAEKQYFPAPGDAKETIDQKRANRELVATGLLKFGGAKDKEIQFENSAASIQPQKQEDVVRLNGQIIPISQAVSWAKQNPADQKAKRVLADFGSVNTQEAQSSINVVDSIKNAQSTEQGKDSWFSEIISSAERRADAVSKIQGSDQSGKSKSLQLFGQGNGLVSDIIGTVVGRTLSAVTPDSIEKPVKEAIGTALANIIQSEPAQRVADNWEKLKKTNPELAGNLAAVGSISGLATTFSGANAAGSAALKTGSVALDAAGKTTKSIGAAVGGTGKFATSQLTGLSREAVGTIVDNPSMFSKSGMASVDRLSLAGKVKDAIDQRLVQLSETGKGYESIRSGGGSVVIPKGSIKQTLGKYGIDIGEDGKLITSSETVPLSSGDKNAIENFLSQYASQSTLSGNGFLNARQALSEMAKYDATSGKTGYSERIARDLRKFIDEHGKQQIQGLSALDKKYSGEVEQLRKLQKDYFNSDGSLKDGALSRIANLGGKGKDLVLSRLENVVPSIRTDVNILKTIEEVGNADFKIGSYLRAGVVGGVVSWGNPIAAVVSALAANPQIAVPIIRTYGIVKGVVVDKVITKMQTGKKLLENEAKVLNDSLMLASGKMENSLVKYAKNIRPGMSVKDIAMNIDETDRKIMRSYIDDFYTNEGNNAGAYVEAAGLAQAMGINMEKTSIKQLAEKFGDILDIHGSYTSMMKNGTLRSVMRSKQK